MSFQYFHYERTWWRLFQKRVVFNKLDFYGFITSSKILKYSDVLNYSYRSECLTKESSTKIITTDGNIGNWR